MKRKTFVKDAKTGQLIESQAVEVRYLASYLHDEVTNMTWTFKEWRGDRRVIFQLIFDKPKLVAMEQTYDKIEITFNNPLLFKAKDGSFVQ